MPHTDPDAAKLDAAVLARQTLAAHLFDTMARDTAESGGPGVTRESYSAAETLAHDLIAKTGGVVVECCFIVDLPDVGGRARLENLGHTVFALCEYEGD